MDLFDNKLDCFFYLDLNGKRDVNFFKMTKVFNKIGLMLVPIRWENLSTISRDEETVNLIIQTNSLMDIKNFSPKLSKSIERMVKANKIIVYHFSSFSDAKIRGCEHSKFYNYIEFPVKLQECLSEIIESNKELRENPNKWPWGKKPAVMRF